MTNSVPGKGRSVVITGGTRGIGLATTLRLLARGDRVAVMSRSGGAPDGALALQCDVTNSDALKEAFGYAATVNGPAEILIANAGITQDGLVLRMSEESFSTVLDANLTSAFRAVSAVTPAMIRARFGRIVLVSSAVAFAGAPGQANYAASKAGLVGLGRSLARELGPRNVTCNVVAPGLIDTDMTSGITAARREQLLKNIPLGRLGEPDEVASAIEYLTSDSAGYVNGSVLAVDGGIAMGH